MTQASENRFLWKKLTSLFVAFVLCLTMVQMPTQEALAAAKDVTSIKIPVVEGITWLDDNEFELDDPLGENYNVEKITDGSDAPYYKLTPLDESTPFGTTVVVMAQADAIPSVTSSDEGVKPRVSQSGDSLYTVRIGFTKAATGDVSLSVEAGTRQYNVAYPYNDDEVYEIQGGLAGTSKTYNEGDPVSFKIKVLHPERQALTVKANGATLEGSLDEGTQDTYTYTIQSLRANTSITITSRSKTFNVNLPSAPEGYTITPGVSPVEYGGSYTFYVTPQAGYQAPTVTANGTQLNPVGNNQYVITNITKDQTITITPAGKEQHTVTFNQGEGYSFTTADGQPIANTQPVTYGDSFSFKIVLKDAYTQSAPTVAVNNINIQPDEEGIYTIPNITADQVVNVTGVQKNIYNVILQQGEGYTLTTTETTKVTAGEIFSFNVAIAEGYQDAGFTVKAKMGEEEIPVSLNEFGYYTCTVNGDLIISVEGVKPITFHATVKEEGSINAVVAPVEGYEADSIAYNGTYQFTVTPKDHYKVTQVAVNGEVKEAVDGVYTVNGITKDLEISVETIQVVTVTFVDGKYNNSREVSYTIEDMQPEGFVTVLAAESGNPTLYAFGGWYDQEGNPVTRITPDDLAKQTITLTAQWVPVFGDILDLTTTGEEFFQDEGDRYVININTVISFSEDLSEEYNANVKITGYGTLYAPEWIDTTNQEIVNAILERDQTVKDGLITENKVAGLQLSNYFRNRDLTPEQVIGQTYGLSKNSSNPMHRYAAGWMELSVDGEKVIVFSNVCEITAPQA